MKILLKCVLLLTIITSTINVMHWERTNLKVKPIAIEVQKKRTVKPKQSHLGMKPFLREMGKIEGMGSYTAVSNRGYLGLYQFHPKTLRGMGIRVSRDEFLNNPSLQDSVMISYLRTNQRSLRKVIREYDGTVHNGIRITKAGILASAHLVGPGGVLAYFYPDRYSFRTVDGNGVSVADYMNRFSKYELRGL